MKQITSRNYSPDSEKTVQTIDQGALVVPNSSKIVTECRTVVNASPASVFTKPRFSANNHQFRRSVFAVFTPISLVQLHRLQSGQRIQVSPSNSQPPQTPSC